MDVTQARSEIAANIRARMGRGLDGRRVTQKQLGEVLSLTQGPVSERLNGQTPFDTDELLAIAAHFEVPLIDLLEGVGIDPPNAQNLRSVNLDDPESQGLVHA